MSGYYVPACGGTEKPFKTRTGHTVQYVWNPVTKHHAYYDVVSDLIIEDDLDTQKQYGLI